MSHRAAKLAVPCGGTASQGLLRFRTARQRPAQAPQTRGQPVFQHHPGVEIVHLHVPHGRVEQRLLRHHADQLAGLDAHPVALRLPPDHFQRAMQGGLAEVGEVHAHLRLAVDQHAERLDVAQAAAGVPDGPGNVSGDINVRCGQIHVQRHQRRPAADHGRSRRPHACRTKIGEAVRVRADLSLQALVFPAADVGQVDPVGTRGRFLVEIDRDAQLIADALAELARQRHARRHVHIAQRHERHHVGGPHAADARRGARRGRSRRQRS